MNTIALLSLSLVLLAPLASGKRTPKPNDLCADLADLAERDHPGGWARLAPASSREAAEKGCVTALETADKSMYRVVVGCVDYPEGGRKGSGQAQASFHKAMACAALADIDMGIMKAMHESPPVKELGSGRVTDPDTDPRTVVPCVPECKTKHEARSPAYQACFKTCKTRKAEEINRTQR